MISGNLFADGGNCVRYQLGITLTNGEYIEGYFYNISYNPKFDFKDISLKEYITQQTNFNGFITLYTKVYELPYPKLPEQGQNCEFHLNGTTKTFERVIYKDDISDVKLIDFKTCNNCDKNNVKDGFLYAGICPVIITELTLREIGFLMNEPIGIYRFSFPNDENSSFEVLSYDKEIDSNKLKIICDEFLKEIQQIFDLKAFNELNDEYLKFKMKLRKQNIVIFKIGFIP